MNVNNDSTSLPYNYIDEFCSCKYIYDWPVKDNYNIQHNPEDMENWMRDVKHIGLIFQGMIWDRSNWVDGPIHTLYHSKCHCGLIEVYIKLLLDSCGQTVCENLIRHSFNNMSIDGMRGHFGTMFFLII
jgi:hypothetical protein